MIKVKVNDIVTICDKSYVTKTTAIGGLELADKCFESDETEFVVLAIDCVFAKVVGQEDSSWQNNTVIQERGSDLVLFVEDDQLERVSSKVREVTMAEVCAQFDEEVKIRKEK